MVNDPVFLPVAVAASSAHKEYHQRAIQPYGKAQFEGRTAHQEDYPRWELQKAEPSGPKSQGIRSCVPFTGASSYAEIFTPHRLEPRPKSVPPAYKGSGANFDATSSYAQDFAAKELLPRQPYAPPSLPPSNAKFDATSSYKDTFQAYQIDPQVHAGYATQTAYVPNTLPLDGRSAYEEDFVRHNVECREPILPRSLPAKSSAFQGTSTSHDAFVAHPLDMSAARGEMPTGRPLRSVPFEGSTTQQEDFRQWPLDKIARHTGHSTYSAIRPSLPFDGSTTHKEAFQGWKLPAKRETLGIATVGDRLHILIPSQFPAPISAKQTFTTVRNGQTEMCLMIYKGNNPMASRNKLLGQFQLIRLPPALVGIPRVQVTFHLDQDQVLTVEAVEADKDRHHLWKEGDGAVVAIDAADVETNRVTDVSQAVAACA